MTTRLPKSALRRLPKSIRGEMRSKFNVYMGDSGKLARTFEGRVYHSVAEAQFAAALALRQKCGDIEMWWPQHRVPLVVNGVTICTMVVDFLVVNRDGKQELIEVKGCETADYKIKAKLLHALYPAMRYTVVKATRCR